MSTDTSEKGLETLILRHMTGMDGLTVAPNKVAEPPPAVRWNITLTNLNPRRIEAC